MFQPPTRMLSAVHCSAVCGAFRRICGGRGDALVLQLVHTLGELTVVGLDVVEVGASVNGLLPNSAFHSNLSLCMRASRSLNRQIRLSTCVVELHVHHHTHARPQVGITRLRRPCGRLRRRRRGGASPRLISSPASSVFCFLRTPMGWCGLLVALLAHHGVAILLVPNTCTRAAFCSALRVWLSGPQL